MDIIDIIDMDDNEDDTPIMSMDQFLLRGDEVDDEVWEGLADIVGQADIVVNPEMKLLGVGSDYLVDDEEEGILPLAQLEQVTQLPMVAYAQPEENKLTKARSERFMSQFSKSQTLSSRAKEVRRKVRDFIESPVCSAVPMTVKFTKSEYSIDGDFPTFIDNAIFNLLQARTDELIPLDYTDLFAKIDDIYVKEEINIPADRRHQIQLVIMKIGTYAEALYIPYANRPLDRIEVQEYIHIESPTLVTSSALVCPCGELVSHPELVPLAMGITKKLGQVSYMLINEPIQCESCRRILALPEQIVLVVEPIIRDIIENQEISIRSAVIYRPPVHLIEQALPANIAHMFDLKNKDYLEIYSYKGPDKAEYLSMYINMVDFWMARKRDEIDPIAESVQVDPTNSALVDFLAKPIKDVFHTLEATEDLQSDILVFTQTLIHYLEELGCFALTHKGEAFYWYCEKVGIQRQAFPKDRTVRWMLKNAWALAGIKVLTSTVDQHEIETNLIADYVPVINYIYMLRTLAKSTRVNPTSNYGYWLKEPATDTSTKFIGRLEAKIRNDMSLPPLARSRRAFRNSDYTFSTQAFSCLHTLATELMDKVSEKELDMGDFLDLYLDVSETTREEFYQIDNSENTESLLIEPVYRFDEFMDFFEVCGYHLFTSAFGSRLIIERAKVLTAALQQRKLKKTFQPAITPQSNKRILLKPKSITEEEYKVYLKEIIYLSDNDLPEELASFRENSSTEEFIAHMHLASTQDILKEDRVLVEKYPEVFGDE